MGFDLSDPGLVAMAALYLTTGILHFVYPRFFYRMIPPIFDKKKINVLVALFEMFLAVSLLTSLRPYAAWAVIALLFSLLPAHVYHLQQKGAGMNVPIWALWLRIPAQGLLIWWAYEYI